MNWYYAEGGQQKGPVTESELARLFQAGNIRLDTLVWRAGLPAWEPYSRHRPAPVPEGAAATLVAAESSTPAPAAPPQVNDGTLACVECGKRFAREQVIQYGDVHVCAACKPVFIQRLREGASPQSHAGRLLSREELLARDYEIRFGEYVRRSWELFMRNPGTFVAGVVIIQVINLGLGLIPFLGPIASLLLYGPLLAGLYLMFLKEIRGTSAVVGDLFSAFHLGYWRLVGTYLAAGLAGLACLIPAGLAAGLTAVFVRGHTGPLFFAGVAACGLLAVAGFVAMIYVTIGWMFALPLAADKRMGCYEALSFSYRVTARRRWSLFFMLLLGGCLMLLGLLACFVGIFVTTPLFMGMFVLMYEDIFGPLDPGRA